VVRARVGSRSRSIIGDAAETRKGRDQVIGALELPLLEQGSVQFMLFVVMVLAICALVWITIAK
jgi:hypothetical protein